MSSVVQLRSNVRKRNGGTGHQDHTQAANWAMLWEEAISTSDPYKLFDLLAGRFADFGFDQIAYVNFQHAPKLLEESDGGTARRTLTYGEDWIEYYGREGYFDEDVLFDLALTNQRPIEWDVVKSTLDLTKRQKLIFDASYEAGLRFGITIPFHGPMGRVATLSVSTSGNRSDLPKDLVLIYALAAQFHALFDAVASSSELVPPPPRLSGREYECLSWAAQGKSNGDIAEIVGIKEPTVQFHMSNVMKKLKVSTRVSAVYEASRLGLLR